MKQVATSMMCVDFFNLALQFQAIEKYTDIYHVDIMDGHFVPNLALSFDFVKQLRNKTNKPIDAHLMITNPSIYLDLLLDSQVDYISFHPSTIKSNVFGIIKKLNDHHVKFGIVLSPSSGLEDIKYYINHIDKITVMTVEPGFAGQKAIPEAVEKIKEVYQFREDHQLSYLIEVDGSNNYTTFDSYHRNGADIFILGSSLFNTDDLASSFENIIRYIGKIDE